MGVYDTNVSVVQLKYCYMFDWYTFVIATDDVKYEDDSQSLWHDTIHNLPFKWVTDSPVHAVLLSSNVIFITIYVWT